MRLQELKIELPDIVRTSYDERNDQHFVRIHFHNGKIFQGTIQQWENTNDAWLLLTLR